MRKVLITALLGSLFLSSCNQSKKQENSVNMQKDSITIWQAELVLDAKARLGEGALWRQDQNVFYWIDNVANELHIFNPETGNDKKYSLPSQPGTIVPLRNGNTMIAMANGVFEWNKESEELSYFVENPEEAIGSRYNDGKCDPSGRFWVGTYAEEVKQCGLYRINPDKSITKMLSDIICSNGIVWSPDKTKMYYIDTPTRMVQQFDYNDETGEISNRKVIINFPEGTGNPDGSAIDEEGMIWIAHWGGACVSRWDPETGKMIGKVEVPCRAVTSVSFGGEDLSTLYITTVREWESDETLQKYPYSGGVFAVKPGVKGVPFNFFEKE